MSKTIKTPKRPNSGGISRGQLYRSRESYLHVAAPIGHQPNPSFDPAFPASALNPAEMPFVIKLGKAGTYNVGRNKAKREKRAAAKAERAMQVGAR
jgi:hypothetical protein